MGEWTLPGKVILVTGGGRGIGAGTAIELARRGAVPVLADIDAAAMAQTAARIGGDVLTLDLDVTDAHACERAVSATIERHGRLDSVWANAGIASFGPLKLEDEDAWTRTVEVNLLGAYRTVRAALPAVVERRGYVAVTASVASFGHAPFMSAYSASKAGVEAMCNALRSEVASSGVAVGTIHPTWIDTDMVREGDEAMSAFTRLRAALPPPMRRTYPLDRAVRDIARGFESRAQRICTPRWVQALHVLRPAMTTRAFNRDFVTAAPEMERLWLKEAETRGMAGASVSERTLAQVQQRGERGRERERERADAPVG